MVWHQIWTNADLIQWPIYAALGGDVFRLQFCTWRMLTFQVQFRYWKWLYFDKNFTEVCFKGSNLQKFNIGWGNGLLPTRRQAIAWANADPVRWCNTRPWCTNCENFLCLIDWLWNWFPLFKAADDDAGNLQPVFLKRLYLFHICIFSFFLFNTSLTTI